MEFQTELGKRLLFFDGAMGTMLQARGLDHGEAPEGWNFTHPELIESIHRMYLDAGCNIIKTNTFGANGLKVENAAETVSAGVRIAKRAAAGYSDALVALDIGPTGRLLEPMGDLPFEEAYVLFAEMAKAGEAAGADLVLIETMSDTYEIKAAVLAAKENTSLPIVVTMIFGESGRLLTGATPTAAAAMLEGLGVSALGFNCGMGPKQMMPLLKELSAFCSVPIAVNPNAGLPHVEGGKTCFDITPEEFAADMETIVRMGAQAVGGCCGTTPDHLAAAVVRCRDIAPAPICEKNVTAVSSYVRCAAFGETPLLIGGRIDAAKDPSLAQALRDGDMDILAEKAIEQQQDGANILKVCVAADGIDEADLLPRAVRELQSITNLPLLLEAADISALECAMRIYNGKPMVCLRSKDVSAEALFPLLRKYGGAALVQAEAANEILRTAAEYGIAVKDLIIDSAPERFEWL